jgi:hypothetical protein
VGVGWGVGDALPNCGFGVNSSEKFPIFTAQKQSSRHFLQVAFAMFHIKCKIEKPNHCPKMQLQEK